MSRILLIKGLLMNLAGEKVGGSREYLSPQASLDALKKMSGQDFGFDVSAWKAWLLDAKRKGDTRFQEPF